MKLLTLTFVIFSFLGEDLTTLINEMRFLQERDQED